MSDQETIERIQQERHTANHASMYEKKKQSKVKEEKKVANTFMKDLESI